MCFQDRIKIWWTLVTPGISGRTKQASVLRKKKNPEASSRRGSGPWPHGRVMWGDLKAPDTQAQPRPIKPASPRWVFWGFPGESHMQPSPRTTALSVSSVSLHTCTRLRSPGCECSPVCASLLCAQHCRRPGSL